MQHLKYSYYIIVSAPVEENTKRILYSTRSGDMLLVTEACYQALITDAIDLLPEVIKLKLANSKILVPADEEELSTIISENIDYAETPNNQLYEVIQPTAMCQLGCYYCGQKHTKDSLEDSLIDKMVTRIHSKFTQSTYDEIYLGWFGAEPLMGISKMRIIYDRLSKAIDNPLIPIRGKIVTNGLSLKVGIFQELISKFKIDKIEITLDGAAEFHDAHRYTKSGEGSFEIIYNNLKNFLRSSDFSKSNCSVVIRCNVDEKNINGIEPLIYQLANDNLHTLIDTLYFVGVYSWGGNDAHKKALTKEKFAMLKLKWEILKVGLGYKHRKRLMGRKLQTCVATGGNSEVYDAFGNIYNCTEIPYADFYNGTSYKLGNLNSDYKSIFTSKPHNDWYATVRDTSRFPCHSCKLLPVCGGSCPKSWEEGNPACPSFKFSIAKELEFEYLLRKEPAGDLSKSLKIFEASLSEKDFYRYE